MSMRVKDILSLAESKLRQSGIESPETDSKILYCYMMNIPRTKLIFEYQDILPDAGCDKYYELLDRRAKGEPIQYILGTQDFMGHTFAVNHLVLIPRPETEVLCENAISLINKGCLCDDAKLIKEPTADFSEIHCGQSPKEYMKKAWSVLDLCTGSGALGVSIAKDASSAKVTCSDLSEDALVVAKKNATSNGVNVNFAYGDLFEPFKKRFGKKVKFDLIVTNPPYVKSDIIPTLQREVKDFEPHMALDGGADGFDIIKRIVSDAPDFLKKQGIIMMEIGDDQMQECLKLFADDERYGECFGIKDLAGRDRIAFAILK